MAVRHGDPEAARYYQERQRLSSGDSDTMTEAAFTAWRTDIAGGLHSLMLTLDREQARSLNERAQLDRQLHDTVDVRPAVRLSRRDPRIHRRLDRHPSQRAHAADPPRQRLRQERRRVDRAQRRQRRLSDRPATRRPGRPSGSPPPM